MFRRSEREELGDLKGSSTQCAIAPRDAGVSKQPFDLTLGEFQESFVGDTKWDRLGILSIKLRQNDENGAEMLNEALDTWGMLSGSVSPAG